MGNCHSDGRKISQFLEKKFKADVTHIDTIEQAESTLKTKNCKADLILVNRIGNFDKRNGLDLIDYVQKNCKSIPIMLITNYKDKMQKAIKLGATKGFGKTNLETKETISLLSKHLK